MLYQPPVENTLILRGFHTYNTPEGAFLRAYLQSALPKWRKYAAGSIKINVLTLFITSPFSFPAEFLAGEMP